MSEHRKTVPMIRRELSAAFPGVPFHVWRDRRYIGGILISWADGPVPSEVRAATGVEWLYHCETVSR